MALSVTGLLGPYAAYIKQFYDLLTGVTTDQVVTLKGELVGILGSGAGQIRMVSGGYGVIWRNDGARLYLLLTASGDPYGGWTGARPLVVNPSNAYVGVNADPAYPLDVGGACHASSFPTSSDQRFKDKVQPLSGILDKVRRLRGVSFEWNKYYANLGRKGQAGTNIGFIAQELELEFPEVVSKWGQDDSNYEHTAEEYRGVDYGRMVPVLLEAIKELAAQNDVMAAQIASLQKDVATLKANVPK